MREWYETEKTIESRQRPLTFEGPVDPQAISKPQPSATADVGLGSKGGRSNTPSSPSKKLIPCEPRKPRTTIPPLLMVTGIPLMSSGCQMRRESRPSGTVGKLARSLDSMMRLELMTEAL